MADDAYWRYSDSQHPAAAALQMPSGKRPRSDYDSDSATKTPDSGYCMLTQNPKQKKSVSEASASIDDLPEEILLHILSLLPTPTAVKTTVVGPAWRNLWHSVPILDFNMDFRFKSPDKLTFDAYQLFAKFINQTLLHRPTDSPLQKFKLVFGYPRHSPPPQRLKLDFGRKDAESIESCVNYWVWYAIASGVAELHLDLLTCVYCLKLGIEHDHFDDKAYEFNFSDLLNSSVKFLRLCGCNLCFPITSLSMKFDCIREMHLQKFCWTDEGIEHLMASCVNVEILSLENSCGLRNLKIFSQKLKHFKLIAFKGFPSIEETSVEICAPSLESVKFVDVWAGKYSLKDMSSSLVEAVVEFRYRRWWDFACWTNLVKFVNGVERLTTQNMWTWFLPKEEPNSEEEAGLHVGEESMKLGEEVFSQTFAFHNLKHLELFTGYSKDDILGLEVLLQKCPQLVTMVLVYSYRHSLEKNIKRTTGRSIVFQMPHLRVVKLKEFRGTNNERYVFGLLRSHGVVLENIVVFPAKVMVDGTSRSPFICCLIDKSIRKLVN